MKAAIIHGYGDPNVLQWGEVETPRPRPGHVLIKVLAAGVNRFDHYIRQGAVTQDLVFPHILGGDAVGEVAALGDGVTDPRAGDRVFVVPGYPADERDDHIRPAGLAPSFTLPGLHRWGAYAHYIEVPARVTIPDETGLAPEAAATLPMVLATSVRAVKEVAQVRDGDRVLVRAGNSGSGAMQIQVAKAPGAQVATTVRKAENVPFARDAGADLVIDTRHDDLVGAVKNWTGGKGADAVIDNLGGDELALGIEAATPAGTIVAYGFAADPQVRFDVRNLFFPQKKLLGTMASDKADLAWGLEQVAAGTIRAQLDRAFPLRDAAAAHRELAAGNVTGNLALLPWAA